MKNHLFIILDAVRYDVFNDLVFVHLPNNPLRTQSHAMWTVPSIFSYLTGISPVRAKTPPYKPGGEAPLKWIPKLLKSNGYHTYMHSGSAWIYLYRDFFSQYFDDFDVKMEHDRLEEFTETMYDEEPFFHTFHILETDNPIFDGEQKYELKKDKEYNLKAMKNSIKYVDRKLPELIDGAPNGTVVTLTADHGECLGENGSWGHGPRVSQAKKNKIGELFRVKEHSKKLYEVPYSVGRVLDGKIKWKDPKKLECE